MSMLSPVVDAIFEARRTANATGKKVRVTVNGRTVTVFPPRKGVR